MAIIGILWRDPSTDPLSERIRRARDYYISHRGTPTTVLVPLSSLEAPILIMGLHVKPDKGVQPGHLIIGVEVEEEEA